MTRRTQCAHCGIAIVARVSLAYCHRCRLDTARYLDATRVDSSRPSLLDTMRLFERMFGREVLS